VCSADAGTSELQIRSVSDDQTWSAFCQIGAVLLQRTAPVVQEIFRESSVWQKGFSGYVGYLAGEPVSTAATVVDNERRGCLQRCHASGPISGAAAVKR